MRAAFILNVVCPGHPSDKNGSPDRMSGGSGRQDDDAPSHGALHPDTKNPAAGRTGGGILKSQINQMISVFLRTAVLEVAFGTELRRELGESVAWVHLDTVVFSATLVRWLEGPTIGWAGEREEFVETVTEAAKRAAGSIDCSVRNGLTTVLLILADDLFWDFHESVNDVTDSTTKLARGRVGGSRRCLDVGDNNATQKGEGASDDEEFFHAAERLSNLDRSWQRFFPESLFFTVRS